MLSSTTIKISKTQKPSTFYENFLIESVAVDTVKDLGKFIYGHNLKGKSGEDQSEGLKSMTGNLRPALMKFIQTNFKVLVERKIARELPKHLLVDLILPILDTKTPNHTSQ